MARKPRNRLLKLMATIRQRAPLLVGRGTVSSSAQVNPLPPVFTVSPTSPTFQSTTLPQTIQFTATDPNGQTVSYGFVSTPANYSIDSSTGLVTVNAGATSQSFQVRATDAGGLYTDSAPCAVTVQAATLEGRIMHTRFSSGISLVETASYANAVFGGGELRLDGTDPVTGDSFTATDPQIWGGYNTSKSSSANLQTLSNGATSLANARQTHIIAFEDNVAFTNPISAPTHPLYLPRSGTQRALKIYRTDGYDGLDQDSFQLYPNTSLPQGMFYVRGTVKFNANFFTNYSLWGCSLAEVKTDVAVASGVERRVQLALANYNSTGWRVLLNAEDTSGWNETTPVLRARIWSISSTPGTPFLVDNCLTFEMAARLSTGSDGWAWAAINGSSTFGGATFQQAGANLPVGYTGKINRIFPFLYYNGYDTGDGVNNPQWFLSTEVWDRWPSDASSHPAWT